MAGQQLMMSNWGLRRYYSCYQAGTASTSQCEVSIHVLRHCPSSTPILHLCRTRELREEVVDTGFYLWTA